jgi:RHS repeat-associated protein
LELSDRHFDPSRSREVPTLDARTRRFDNPDGSHSLRIGASPLKGKDATGGVGDIDLSLVSGGDGWLHPKRSAAVVSIAGHSQTVMAGVELAPGQRVELGEEVVKAGVTPVRTPGALGETARFDQVLAHSTSLELRPLSQGVESTYVVPSVRAADGIVEHLTLPAGVTARQIGGSIDLVNSAGAVVGRWLGGAATDSGPQQLSTAVRLEIAKSEGRRVTARVVVDRGWLGSPKRIYPVRIDPAVIRKIAGEEFGSGATYVQNGSQGSPPPQWMGAELRLGTYDGGADVARTLIAYPLDGIPAHSRIISAQMSVYETWSYSCQKTVMEAHRITSAWDGGTTVWSNQPGFGGVDGRVSAAAGNTQAGCGPAWQQVDISGLVADWYNGVAPPYGVLLKAADEGDSNGWKRFAGAGTPNPPLLDITYESYGTNPIAVNDADTQPPATIGPGFQGMTLTNQGTDVWPANGNYQISYHIYQPDGTRIRDGAMPTLLPTDVGPGRSIQIRANIEQLPMGDYILAWDMVQQGVAWFSTFGVATVNRSYHSNQPPTQAQLISPDNGEKLISVTPTLSASSTDPDGPHLQYLFRICTGTDANSGQCTDSGWTDASSWQVPRGALSWGTTYHWSAQVRDNSPGPFGYVAAPAPFAYTPVLPVTQPEWAFGSDPYVNYQSGVNTALGNYVYTTRDLSIPTVGPPLEVARTYNSMDADDGLGLKPGGGTYGFGKWFGTGWSSPYETNMIFDQAGNAQVDYPDGRREFLIANGDGSYQPAFGFVSAMTVITQVSGGQSHVVFYDLKHRDQSVWRFTPDGRLDSMTDPYGHRVQLAWNVGGGHCCASVTITDQPSGRWLTATFSAPADQFGRVTSVVSSPVTVGGVTQQLRWSYGYDANKQLSSACDPTGACTTYTNAGAHNQLTAITRAMGNTPLTLGYDDPGRIRAVTDGGGNVTTFSYLSTPPAGAPTGSTKTTVVTDPAGHTTQSSYNQMNQLLQHVNEDGHARTYTFDQHGFLNTVTDENGHHTGYTNDAASNVQQVQDGAGGISYREYDAQNRVKVIRGPRSSGPTDPTYATSYGYDAAGNLTSQTTPAGTWTWGYSFGTEAAVGGGTTPPNLLLTATDAMGHRTTYAYDAAGNIRRQVDPSGLTTEFSYDELGRETSRKQISDSFPNGLVTTAGYDLDGRTAVLTEPRITNVVTGTSHQRVTTTTYNKNGNPSRVVASDAIGGDATRQTSYTYDADDRQSTITDAAGKQTTTYDALGNVSQVTDALGRVTKTTYTVRNQPEHVTLLGFVDSGGFTRDLPLASYTYDNAGRRVTATDPLGRTVRFDYDDADRPTKTTLLGYHNRDGSTRDIVLESREYDPDGHVTSQVEGGGLRTTAFTYDPAGRLVTSAVAVSVGVTRTVKLTYDANGNVLSRSLTDGTRTEQVLDHYDLDQPGRPDRTTVVNGGGGADLVTTRTYDQRDLVTAVVDPRGNTSGANPAAYTTTFSRDGAGRLVGTTAPPVSVESGGSPPATQQPSQARGYDTFGDLTQIRDAQADVTTIGYDLLGRRTSVTYPRCLAPGGAAVSATESWGYDAAGNTTRWTDRRGQVTTYAYDMLNRLASQTDPKVTGQAAGGVTTISYDDVGNPTGVKDQVGAQQWFAYDDLNRMRTSTQIVTLPGTGNAAAYTATYDYDDLGDQTYQATPLGEVTASQYNAMGELTKITDPTGQVTTIQPDLAGRLVRLTDPLGRSIVDSYDPAGRLQQETRTDASGATLAAQSWRYDSAGNPLTATDALGHTIAYRYDALSRLTQLTEPTSATNNVTTSFGYDAAANQTRVTDGNGHATVSTYNAWNLPETRVEPATAAHPNLADRTWTWTYDAGGLPVREDQPGVTITYGYDELGRLSSDSGTGVSSTYGHDLAGRLTSATGTAGGQTFGYDERGLLTSASGVAGGSSFRYDGDGQLVTRTDASGMATFGWDTRGQLASISEPVTGTQQTLRYDAAGQLKHIGYGTGGPTRDYDYNGLGQPTSDVVKTGSGALVAQAGYTYDANGNLRQRQLTTASGSGTDSYEYDDANRLTSWTDALGTVTGYGWDGAGNRIRAGSVTATYDERNRLLTSGTISYGWAANGNLLSQSDSYQSTGFGYDGLNRLVSVQQSLKPPLSGGSTTTYAYDGLDRVVKRNQTAFAYAGQDQDPASDGGFSYSHGPDGDLLAVTDGKNPLLAALDRHGDLSMTFDTSGTAKGTFRYDPFGAAIPHFGTSGPAPSHAGFQGQWTDPTTGKVLMGARWYDGGTGRFLTQDSRQPAVAGFVDVNGYAYGRANPLGYTDPDGHCPDFLFDWPDACAIWDETTGQPMGCDATCQAAEQANERGYDTCDQDSCPCLFSYCPPPDDQPQPGSPGNQSPGAGGPPPYPYGGQPRGGGPASGGGRTTPHGPDPVAAGRIPAPRPPAVPRPPGGLNTGRIFLPPGASTPPPGQAAPPPARGSELPPDTGCHTCQGLAGTVWSALTEPGPFDRHDPLALPGSRDDTKRHGCDPQAYQNNPADQILCTPPTNKQLNPECTITIGGAAHWGCGAIPDLDNAFTRGLSSSGDPEDLVDALAGRGAGRDAAYGGPGLGRSAPEGRAARARRWAGRWDADATPTTPVLGRKEDTKRYRAMPGYFVLKLPGRRWNAPLNDWFIQHYIDRGARFRIVSEVKPPNIRGEHKDYLISVFGRELRQLWNAGYRLSPDGRWMEPPK